MATTAEKRIIENPEVFDVKAGLVDKFSVLKGIAEANPKLPKSSDALLLMQKVQAAIKTGDKLDPAMLSEIESEYKEIIF